MSRWFKSKLFWLALAVAITCAAVWVRGRAASPSFATGTVRYGDLSQNVTIAGTITPDHTTMISAPYSAYVKKIYVQIGQRVKADDPIVSLTESLNGEHEQIYPIRAPISGVVVQILKMEGEYVDQQNTNGNGIGIVRIDDLKHLHVDADSPEFQVGKIKVGQDVIVRATAVPGHTYKGRVDAISLAAKEEKDWDKSRVEFAVAIDLLDADSELKPGMSVICDIETGRADHVLVLDQQYLQQDEGKYYVVTQGGERTPVAVGLQNEEAFEIRSGVYAGEKVRQTDFLSLTKY